MIPPTGATHDLGTAKGIAVRCTLSPAGRGQGEGFENPPVIPFAVLKPGLQLSLRAAESCSLNADRSLFLAAACRFSRTS